MAFKCTLICSNAWEIASTFWFFSSLNVVLAVSFSYAKPVVALQDAFHYDRLRLLAHGYYGTGSDGL